MQYNINNNISLSEQQERNRSLIELFPFLKPDDDNYDYHWTKLEELPKGWLIAFGSDLLWELRELLVKNNCLGSYELIEIKEKFGMLRWYGSEYPNEIRNEMRTFEKKYHVKSAFTCIECGKPATVVTSYYIKPLCNSCVQKEITENPDNAGYRPIEECYKYCDELADYLVYEYVYEREEQK